LRSAWSSVSVADRGDWASSQRFNVESVLLSDAYEAARVSREGAVSDKFDALADYFGVYVGGRVLAYLGGFPTAGLK